MGRKEVGTEGRRDKRGKEREWGEGQEKRSRWGEGEEVRNGKRRGQLEISKNKKKGGKERDREEVGNTAQEEERKERSGTEKEVGHTGQRLNHHPLLLFIISQPSCHSPLNNLVALW